MLKKSILTGIIILGMGLVGCQSTYNSVKAYSSEVKNVKVKSKDIRVTYEDFKINIPKRWEKSTIEDMDFYKLEERNANLSIALVKYEDDLDSYIESVKKFATNTLGAKEIKEDEIEGMHSISYSYNLSQENDIYTNQVYLKVDDKIYVFTLMSDEDDYDIDVDVFKKVIETIR